jgi:hypothetical protein
MAHHTMMVPEAKLTVAARTDTMGVGRNCHHPVERRDLLAVRTTTVRSEDDCRTYSSVLVLVQGGTMVTQVTRRNLVLVRKDMERLQVVVVEEEQELSQRDCNHCLLTYQSLLVEEVVEVQQEAVRTRWNARKQNCPSNQMMVDDQHHRQEKIDHYC